MPFYLLYGREAHLPVDSMEIRTNTNLLKRIEDLIEIAPEMRQNAKEQIKEAQIKQKEMYDKQISHEDHFQIGQKVLYYKAAQDNQHTGKLLPKWKGPYFIHDKQSNGAYKIRTQDGKVLKSPVNGTLLKLYFEYK